MMTRRDYVAIADILKLAIQDANTERGENTIEAYHCINTVVFIAEHIAEYCKKDNARFDTRRFLEAVTATEE